MTCAEIDDLAGAIALGAIPRDEWPAVRAHLETCERGHAEVPQLMSVATLLLEAAPPVEPPASLRERILAAARADDESSDGRAVADAPPLMLVPPAPGYADAPPTAAPPPLRSARRTWWESASWAAIAALFLLSFGMTAWNVTLRRDLANQRARSAVSARALEAVTDGQEVRFDSTQPGAAGVVLRPSSGSAVLVFNGLPRVAGTYQVWALRSGTPVSLGVFTPDANGRGMLDLEQDLTDVDAVAITVEPGPKGSRIPTSAPILSAPVQS